MPKGAGRLPDRILCLPQSGTQVGVDGPLRLVQTPEQITWASEEMHTIRRIFLTGEFSKGFKPNYYGEAIGHWDGNTLVVETVGMKSLPAGAKMVERWTKGADGRTLKIEMGNVDASGKALGATRTQNLSYRTGEQVYEWMCEDYNDEWLPGGADYDDQVGNDLIGLDTAYEILDTMYKQGRDRLHAPSPIIKQMVSAGLKGRKNGRGFYTYAAAGSPEVVADAQTPAEGTRAGVEVRTIESVGVIGSGTMATGIVEVFAKAGYAVTFVARGQDKVDGVLSAIAKSQAKMIERGRLTQEEADAINGRIMGATERTVLGDVDIVVEAIAEDLAIKQELFRDLDQICKPGAILATTTSSLPIIDCAKVTSRPGDVIGMHFFNPAQIMKLVEVVHTVATEPDVVATVQNLCASVGKVAVTCGDRSGFIVNALLFPYLNDAIKMLEANYASADDIDTAMKTGCGLPMGPFELLDVVGLDVSLAIQKELYLEFREPGYAPAPLLEHLVTAGYLGRKTGRGFRTY